MIQAAIVGSWMLAAVIGVSVSRAYHPPFPKQQFLAQPEANAPTEQPLPAEEMVDKKWEVTCALPGQPVREWIVTMPRPLFHPSGHYLLKADGKDLMLPVACTMIEEQ